jgi:t-SNARE complex subunit (syntaxin)
VTNYLAAFDDIYKRYEQSLQNNDETAVSDCENKYMEWTNQTADLMSELNNDEKYQLSRYLAKLAISWSDLRTDKQQ